MKRKIGAGLAIATLVTGFTTPFVADAASAQRSYTIATRIVERPPSVGEFDGALTLNVSADGIVSGYYRPDDNARFISVAGGVTGERLWLEIGALSPNSMRFTGTFRNGRIEASSTSPLLDNGRITSLELTGTPKAG